MLSLLRRLAVVAFILGILAHAYYGFVNAHPIQDPYQVPWPTCVTEVGLALRHYDYEYGQGLDHVWGNSVLDAMKKTAREQVRVGTGYQTECVTQFSLKIAFDGCFCVTRDREKVPDIFGGHYGEWTALKGISAVVLILTVLELSSFRRCKLQSLCKLWKRRPFTWESQCFVEDEHVRREIVRARCHYASKCAKILRPFVFAAFAFEAIRLNIRYPLQKLPSEPVGQDAIMNYDYAVMKEELIGGLVLPLGFFSVVLTLLARSRPTPCTEALNWSNFAWSAMMMWRYATLPAQWYTYYTVPLWVARVIQGFMFGNFKLSMLLQFSISIVDIYAFNALNLWRGHEGHRPEWQGYALIQVIMLPAVLCLLAGFQKVQFAQAVLLLKARRADNASALANRLLSSMSDAVVHLDGNLRITKPCPQFASLMLRSRGDCEVVGKPFKDFLQHGDQERFVHDVVEGRGGPGEDAKNDTEKASTSHVRVMHVHLVDARQSPFAVEIFTASFPDVDGDSTSYILGIKEEEADERTLTAMPPKLVPTIPERSAAYVETQSLQCCFSLESHSIADETSSTLSVGSCIDFSDDSCVSSSKNWVCVDLASLDMNILQCSPALYFKIPPGCEATGFADWFNDVDAIAVWSYLKAGDQSHPLTVSFMPWGLGRTTYTANLVIDDLLDSSALVVSDGCQMIRVLFSGVKMSEKSDRTSHRIVVRIKGLDVLWTPKVQTDKKVYKALFEHTCLPLVNPEALEDELRTCCAAWIAAKQAPFECPRELGVYALKPNKKKQTLLPQLMVTLEKFMDVDGITPVSIDRTWAEISVSVRFDTNRLRSISL